jgi:hypothetical protein
MAIGRAIIEAFGMRVGVVAADVPRHITPVGLTASSAGRIGPLNIFDS